MNRESVAPETPSSWRVERRIWWLTVSNAAERSNGTTTEDREAVWSFSVMARKAVSVERGECPWQSWET